VNGEEGIERDEVEDAVIADEDLRAAVG